MKYVKFTKGYLVYKVGQVIPASPDVVKKLVEEKEVAKEISEDEFRKNKVTVSSIIADGLKKTKAEAAKLDKIRKGEEPCEDCEGDCEDCEKAAKKATEVPAKPEGDAKPEANKGEGK